jgi:hypothetical protein
MVRGVPYPALEMEAHDVKPGLVTWWKDESHSFCLVLETNIKMIVSGFLGDRQFLAGMNRRSLPASRSLYLAVRFVLKNIKTSCMVGK